jgi:cell division protein FtsQ
MKRNPEQAAPFFQRRIVVIGVSFLAMLFAAAAAWTAWTYMPDLPVRDVVFKGGTGRVSAEELKRVANAIGHARVSLLRADLSEVKAAVKQVEWVRDAEVRRRLPGTLEVTLREQVPVARWIDTESDGNLLLNDGGEIFKAALSEEEEAPLPVLGGPPEAGRDVLAKLSEVRQWLKPIERTVRGLMMNARGGWQVTLDNGATLVLGRADEEARLKRFVRAYPQIPALQLANAHIDLRYQSGLAIEGVVAVKTETKKKRT